MALAQDLIAEFANAAEIDYLDLGTVSIAADEADDLGVGLSPRDRTLALLSLLLARGFQAVDLEPGGGCTPWPDQRPDAVLARIAAAWDAAADPREIGFSFWFDLPEDRRGG
jgi:hypothetical protein